MTEDEMKAAIDAANAERDALKAKNAELKAEKAKAQKAADEAKDAAEAAAEEKARADGDAASLEATLTKKFQKQIDALTAERDSANTHLNTLLVDNTISKALVDSNVAAHLHEPLTAMFKAKATVKDGKAYHDDAELADHLKGYFDSDAGKHFVIAPNNSGSGATGAIKPVLDIPDTWNLTRYAEIKKDNPELANAYAKRNGKTFDQ